LCSDSFIWRVNSAGPDDVPKVFIKAKYMPGAMSVTSQRLLVTPVQAKGTGGEGFSFYLYDADGKLLKTIPWRINATFLHSVETTYGTFIACCTGGPQNIMNDQVSWGFMGITIASKCTVRCCWCLR
jgi:hypothetical protein